MCIDGVTKTPSCRDVLENVSMSAHKERKFQIMLLCVLRGLTQFGRMTWPALAVFIMRDMNLTKVQIGELLSAFALGYLVTQVVGGMAADRLGGKPVQVLTLLSLSVAMMLGPAIATASGVSGLYWLYLIIGFFAGPSHPACNATMSEWFSQQEMGVVSSMADIFTVGGELAATAVAPVLASHFGWRWTFIAVGAISSLFTVVWVLFAKSRPEPEVTPSADASGSPQPQAVGGKSSDGVKNSMVCNDSRDDGRGALTIAMRVLCCLPVWAVIIQHMCFNGSKYFFSAWMPVYFDQKFGLGPERAAIYLSLEKFVGIGTTYACRFAEAALLRRGGVSLLFSRRFFAACGFGLNALSLLCLALLCSSGGSPSAPALTGLLLCVNSAGLSAHSFGFKPNYLDITARYSGAFMGAGNTCATMMTYAVPLGAAHMVEAAGGDWTGLFARVALLSVVGAAVGVRWTSTERLDAELESLRARKVD